MSECRFDRGLFVTLACAPLLQLIQNTMEANRKIIWRLQATPNYITSLIFIAAAFKCVGPSAPDFGVSFWCYNLIYLCQRHRGSVGGPYLYAKHAEAASEAYILCRTKKITIANFTGGNYLETFSVRLRAAIQDFARLF